MVLAAQLVAAARPCGPRHARLPDLASRAPHAPLFDGNTVAVACSCRPIGDRLTHAHCNATRGAPTLATRASVEPFVVEQPINPNQVVLTVDGNSCITRVDADAHQQVGPLASQRGEVMALALWLMAEHAGGGKAAPLVDAVLPADPATLLTPLLWDKAQVQELLRGSPVAEEALQRRAAIDEEWQALQAQAPALLPPDAWNAERFATAVAAVLASAVYLPSAECLALVPGVSTLARTGTSAGCLVDYDVDRGEVVLTAQGPINRGDPLLLFDARPNGELLLACGQVERNNPSSFLVLNAELLQADRMYTMKKQIVQDLGFEEVQEFPVYADRMPVQLLSYLRLSRISDAAQLARVTFTDDVPINDMNEYEVLQLVMGDCRERLQAYETAGDMEVEVKLLQDPNLDPRQRVACELRLDEKRILRGTMDGARRRLAPIRGIPTKSGQMADPNQDLLEVFSAIEELPNAPKKMVDGFLSWARGDKDPDWR